MGAGISQLALALRPAEPYALSYFVTHSGVVDAVSYLERLIEEAVADHTAFHLVYLYGPRGAGKRHLVEGYYRAATSRAYPEDRCLRFCFDSLALPDDAVAGFVAAYERCRSAGGVILAAGESHPSELSENPHLTSRLLSGNLFALCYPREEELRPILVSLMERRNLRLSERSLDFLLRRLPLDPLSFDTIFDRISELCYQQGKGAGFKAVRTILQQPDPDGEL